MAQWNIDNAHTSADFIVRHMMVTNVRGSFNEINGLINFDPENPANSSVEVTINVDSVGTGVQDRDNHLRSADFFEVEKFPHISFKSTNLELIDESNAKITGDLTIRDVTRTVVLDAEFLGQIVSPYGDTRVGFEARTKINREDFGLTWNQALEAGGVLVGKDIKIELAVEAVRVAETATA